MPSYVPPSLCPCPLSEASIILEPAPHILATGHWNNPLKPCLRVEIWQAVHRDLVLEWVE